MASNEWSSCASSLVSLCLDLKLTPWWSCSPEGQQRASGKGVTIGSVSGFEHLLIPGTPLVLEVILELRKDPVFGESYLWGRQLYEHRYHYWPARYWWWVWNGRGMRNVLSGERAGVLLRRWCLCGSWRREVTTQIGRQAGRTADDSMSRGTRKFRSCWNWCT